MTYKEALTQSMEEMARDPKTCFIGYGVTTGFALGTLKGVSPYQLIETPVAENLMVGMAIGMALKGRKPVVFIERMDFILNAADAIVNHLDKLATISGGQFQPAIIIRCVVGNKERPLFTGETHTQNLSRAFREMVSFPVYECRTAEEVLTAYRLAFKSIDIGMPSIIVEFKDLI